MFRIRDSNRNCSQGAQSRSIPPARSLAVISLLSLAGQGAAVQPARTTVLRVTVIDSAGIPSSGAEVTVTRGLRDTVAHARADEAGRRFFKLSSDTSAFQVVARKIGFARADRFFRAGSGDTVLIELRLGRWTTPLPTVHVTEGAALAAHYINADEIERESRDRTIYDAMDILRKLRPYMLRDPDRCPRDRLQNIWVNGRRVSLGRSIGEVLKEIRAEHVSEIRDANCWDRSMPGVAGLNSAFIILKPGVAYRSFRGSFIPDSFSRPSRARPEGLDGQSASLWPLWRTTRSSTPLHSSAGCNVRGSVPYGTTALTVGYLTPSCSRYVAYFAGS